MPLVVADGVVIAVLIAFIVFGVFLLRTRERSGTVPSRRPIASTAPGG